MSFVLQCKNITKEYDGNVILKGISLNIYPGEFITILGPSGCGKTTFLRILSGIEKQNSGEIILNNKSMYNVPSYKRPINTIFQNYALFPHMNVFDNIAYGLKIKRISKEIIKKEVKKFLELVNLTGFQEKKITELSGGQKQRVAIARALINSPKILLLDEPMAALDVKLRKQMQLNLKKIQQEVGITFILVTHDQEEALTLSDRVVVLNDGTIEQVGTPTEIYNLPENSWVASFIGSSNIITNGKIIKDKLVSFDDLNFECLAEGFGKDENSIDILIRPEDMDIVKKDKGYFNVKIVSKIFKGIFWEIKVKYKERHFIVNTINDKLNINQIVGIIWDKEDLHVMWKAVDE